MGKISDLQIVYQNDKRAYYAGSEVRGRLRFSVDEPVKVEGVHIEFKGKAKTSWSRHHGKSSTSYTAAEEYFNETVNLDCPSRSSDGRLSAGEHEISFVYPLNQNLPSSFEGTYGRIRYTCCAVITRSWKFNLTCKSAFTVIALEDLNVIHDSRDPIEMEELYQMRFLCFSRGAISLSLTIPRKGFVPGESIPISAHIINNSSSTISSVKARIKQYVKYTGYSHWGFQDCKLRSCEVAKVKRKERIQPGSIQDWSPTVTTDSTTLAIPPIPPRLVSCKIIDVRYALKFNVGSYINCEFPLIIGTIPLSINEEPPAYESVETPPPAYHQCFVAPSVGSRLNFMADDDADDEDDDEYSPLVVYYQLLGVDLGIDDY